MLSFPAPATTHRRARTRLQARGSSVSSLHLLLSFFLVATVHQVIGRRNEEERDDEGKHQASDDGACQRSVLLATRFQGQCHGNQSEEGVIGCHYDES